MVPSSLALGLAGSIAISLVVSGVFPPYFLETAIFIVGVGMVILSVFRLINSSSSSMKREPRAGEDLVHDMGVQAILRDLAQAAEHNDGHTHGHCRRVAFSAERIAESLGMTQHECVVVRWAALLHDVGKAGVPDGILMKPGRLTTEEFEEVQKHCQAGADLIVTASPELAEVAKLVLAHHERWDGRGYPLGMRGLDIPLGARIIAVADVFEALTSERPYRAPMTHGEALVTIAAGAGTHFDPDVVAVFQRLCQYDGSGSVGLTSSVATFTNTRLVFASSESASILLIPPTN